MTGPENYGQLYWCVGLEDGTEVYLHADDVEVKEGALIFSGDFYLNAQDEMAMSAGYPDYRKPSGNAYAKLGFAPNAWRFFYAASVLDGSAVAVNRWPGQIIESNPAR